MKYLKKFNEEFFFFDSPDGEMIRELQLILENLRSNNYSNLSYSGVDEEIKFSFLMDKKKIRVEEISEKGIRIYVDDVLLVRTPSSNEKIEDIIINIFRELCKMEE